MKSLYKYATLIFLIVAAIISYTIGWSTGAFLFIALGCLFELAFWIGLLNPRFKSKTA